MRSSLLLEFPSDCSEMMFQRDVGFELVGDFSAGMDDRAVVVSAEVFTDLDIVEIQ